MVAKMVLPLLGGSASVWSTCVLFFQTMLLAGYVYAHGLSRTLRLRQQFAVHGTLMLAALAFLPIAFSTTPGGPAMNQPSAWLLLQLLGTIGVPFFVLSATAPLLQNWLVQTRFEASSNPYVLYAASNAGSLLSLVIYPLLVEPRTGVIVQSTLWTGGYGLLLLMVAGAVVFIWKGEAPARIKAALVPPDAKTRARWLAAAFVPSALMLAVTNHISVNLASVPFLWIVPLAVYLLTFILAFARPAPVSMRHFRILSIAAPFVLLLLLPAVPDVAPPDPSLNLLLMGAHITVLFFGAYLCHTALAASRPDPRQLTEFYFWLALGGALGGAFAALIAPNIFNTVLEYPLLVGLLPLFRHQRELTPSARWKDFAYPGILAAAFAVNWYAGETRIGLAPDVAFFAALLLFSNRRLRFGLAFAVVLFGYTLTLPSIIEKGTRVYVARNFFGVKKVLFDSDSNVRKLLHGDTLHGTESLDRGAMSEPLSYYHRNGPAGDVMKMIEGRQRQEIAVVGLGTGSMAAYGGPNRRITFFDVDPQVEEIAQRFFFFLRSCGKFCTVVIGDGRREIEARPDGHFDVLMLDAFSSDSIPPHLVSQEALQIYLRKLKPGGLMLFHVSNRYLNVGKLVASAVSDADLIALARTDRDATLSGKTGSDYIVAARRPEDLGILLTKPTWKRISVDASIAPWTDDYSNMLDLVKWR